MKILIYNRIDKFLNMCMGYHESDNSYVYPENAFSTTTWRSLSYRIKSL